METFSYTVLPNDTIWSIAKKFNTTVLRIQQINPKANLHLLTEGTTINILQDNFSLGSKPFFRSISMNY